MIKNLKKDPFKPYLKITKILRIFSPELITQIGNNLKIESETIDSIKNLLSDKTRFEDLSKDEAEALIRKMFRIHEGILNRKRKRTTTHSKSKYGGSTVFDGNKRKPINRLADKGTTRN